MITRWLGWFCALASALATAAPAAALHADAELEVGRALFEGRRPLATRPTVAGVRVPQDSAHCAACHGAQGQGRLEAGVAVPSLQWRQLTHSRQGLPAFSSAEQVAAAVAQGRSRVEGVALALQMPRFELTAPESRALLAYLKVVGTEDAPVQGVFADAVRLGTVLPLSGPQGDAGRAALQAMRAQLERVNAAGGIFGRQLLLRAGDSAEAGSDAALFRLLDEEGVFALVGSWLADPSDALLRRLAQENVPSVGAIGMPLGTQHHRLTTYLLPSVQSQVDLALQALRERCSTGAASEVWYTSDKTLAALGAGSSLSAGRAAGGGTVRPVIVTQTEQQVSEVLRTRSADKFVLLLPAAQLPATHALLEAPGLCVATLAGVSGVAHGAAQPAQQVLVYPLPERALDVHGLWATLGSAAAGVLTEALARAGRVLDADRLLSAVEGLREFEAAPGFPVSFTPTVRHASANGFVRQ